MLTALLRTRLGQAIVDRIIARATRTPYFHLFHDDGRPYMERYWLVRFGMPAGWRGAERHIAELQHAIKLEEESLLRYGLMPKWQARVRELQMQLVPKWGIRVHRILSSDEPVFHDHPWNYTTLILRGGYREVTPDWSHGPTPAHVTTSDDYDGHPPSTYLHTVSQFHAPGRVLRRRAGDWHYLQLRDGEEAWTLFFTGPKLQGWGFLVDGLIKVPWRTYLDARRRFRARQRARAESAEL